MLIVLSLGGLFFFTRVKPEQASMHVDIASLQCPEYYETEREVADALLVFFLDFKSKYPDASMEDFVAARIDFYIAKSCTDELKKYGYDGTSPITQELRKQLIANFVAFSEKYKEAEAVLE